MVDADSHTNEQERAILVGVCSPTLSDEENSNEDTLNELEELLKTAGGVCCAKVLQNRTSPDSSTFIGEGKAQEIHDFIKENKLSIAVFDNNLSPSQTRNLEKALDCHVIDRSALILDIFASRARTREGKLQVELAQYQYLLPRLTGLWGHLVKQTAAGGKSPIGTRGPGETQLETDRRHIHRKIAKLKEELEDVKRTRGTQRRQREKSGIPLVAIVGYTNAGKSTLLNHLTNAGIEANNRLFDTLDPTTRTYKLPNGKEILISDTVGFIKKLPHTLVSAFKATLEELVYADLILHVIDGASLHWQEQAAVTERLINELDLVDIPRIEVYNKSDLFGITPHKNSSDKVWVSAKTGAGIEELISLIEQKIDGIGKEITLVIPYEKAGEVDQIHKEMAVKKLDYRDDAIYINAVCDGKAKIKYTKFIQDKE